MTLCGISSRFQLLSPTERQVSHALLTRSPLSDNRNHHSVRLACVRHAASVRPEPGSNSQKIVSKRRFHRSNHFLNNLLLAILLKNFVGCSLFALIHELLNKSINLSKVFGLSLRYSIYKVQVAWLTAEAHLSYHTLFHLSRTFFKFFQISLSRFDSVVCCHLAATKVS